VTVHALDRGGGSESAFGPFRRNRPGRRCTPILRASPTSSSQITSSQAVRSRHRLSRRLRQLVQSVLRDRSVVRAGVEPVRQVSPRIGTRPGHLRFRLPTCLRRLRTRPRHEDGLGDIQRTSRCLSRLHAPRNRTLPLHEHPGTRYCTGYLSDIGAMPPFAPMHFATWFETYLGRLAPTTGCSRLASSKSRSSAHRPSHERLSAVHAEDVSHTTRSRVLLLETASDADLLVHDPAAIGTAADRHNRASVIVIGTALSLHSPRLLGAARI